MTRDPSARALADLRQLAAKVRSLERQVGRIVRAPVAPGVSFSPGGVAIHSIPDATDGASGFPVSSGGEDANPIGAPTIRIGTDPDGTHGLTTYGGTPQPAPSAPLIAQVAGGVTVTWDGYDATGTAGWSTQLAYVSVRMSTVPAIDGGDVIEVSRLPATVGVEYGGAVTVAQPAGVTTYVTLVAVLTSGVESATSTEVAAVGGSADAIADGTTLSTAPTGQRVVVDGATDSIRTYTGLVGETAGYIDPSPVGPNPAMQIAPGTTPTYAAKPQLIMLSDVTQAVVDLIADQFSLADRAGTRALTLGPSGLLLLGNGTVFGHLTVAGTGWRRPATSGGSSVPLWGTSWADFDATAVERVAVKRVGNGCRLVGAAVRSGGAATTVLTLPSDMWPLRDTYRVVQCGAAWGIAAISAAGGGTPGAVTLVYAAAAYADGQPVVFDASWDLDQP